MSIAIENIKGLIFCEYHLNKPHAESLDEMREGIKKVAYLKELKLFAMQRHSSVLPSSRSLLYG